MKQRIPLLIAAGLTAFMLVLGGGLAARLLEPASVAPVADTAAPVVDAAAGSDPALLAAPEDPAVQTLLDREAAYEQALQQANAQLQQAYQDQQRLADQVKTLQTQAQAAPTAAPTAPAAPTDPPAPTYALSPQQAALVALRAAPGATLTAAPDAVDFQGQVAYEVRLTRGTVYIDANSGQVLFNGATASRSNAGGAHDDSGYEGHAGDD